MLAYRKAKETDEGFIVTNWVNSYRPFCRWIPRPVYARLLRQAIHASIDGDGVTWIACLESNPDVVIGWAHGQPGILHYVFVRKDYRNVSSYPICNQLIARFDRRKVLLYTHHTIDFTRKIRDHYVYRPDCWRPELPRKEEKIEARPRVE